MKKGKIKSQSIGKKLFITLIFFSLVPLLSMSIVSRQGIKDLGQEQSDKLRVEMLKILRTEMLQSAKDSAKLVQSQTRVLEFALLALEASAEDFLNESPPPINKVYFSKDFIDPQKSPPDLKKDPKYFVVHHNGTTAESKVSIKEPVFYFPVGSAAPDELEVAKLHRLKDQFKSFYKSDGTSFYRFHVTLKSGLQISYPGQGNYPKGYNPTSQKWYQAAIVRDDIAWGKYLDTGTGQQIYTISIPLKDDFNNVLGVAGIDIKLLGLLRKNDLSNQWSSDLKTFVVGPELVDNNLKLNIWAESGHDNSTGWQETQDVKFKELTSINKKMFNIMVIDIVNGRHGVVRMDYNGVDSMWAYAPFREKGGYVLIVPERFITKLPDNAAKRVLKLTKKLYLTVGFTTILIFCVIAIFAFLSSRKIVHPLKLVSAGATKIARGDFNVKVEVNTGDEREQLADAFNDMIPKLEDHVRITKSMELAKEVQDTLLPSKMPKVHGLDIAGCSHSCDETGGDYFDFYTSSDGGLGVMLGDVTGHGVSAALLMATGRAHLKHASRHKSSLSKRIEKVNNLLCTDIGDTGRFMTLFCLEISPDLKNATFVRAGHDPALVYHPQSNSKRELIGTHMLALGIIEESGYKEESVELKAGEIICIATDGIWEARNIDNEMFGHDRLDKIIQENSSLSAVEITDAVLDGVKTFQGEVAQEDDITLVIIKIKE